MPEVGPESLCQVCDGYDTSWIARRVISGCKVTNRMKLEWKQRHSPRSCVADTLRNPDRGPGLSSSVVNKPSCVRALSLQKSMSALPSTTLQPSPAREQVDAELPRETDLAPPLPQPPAAWRYWPQPLPWRACCRCRCPKRSCASGP